MTIQSWPDQSVLEANRQRLLRELQKQLRVYENRYELKSEQIDAELQAGHIRDTAEVCDWVIAFHTYQVLERGR